jgi:hypothetical protein
LDRALGKCINSVSNSNAGETLSSIAGNKLSEPTSQQKTDTTSSKSTSLSKADTTPKDIYNRIDNKTHKNQLLKAEYPIDSLQKRFARNGDPFAGYALSIKEIDDTFPIECIRKVSKKFFYIVYKVKEGGYLYVHLINPNEGEWTGQNNGLEHSSSYYVNDKSDIAKIRIGDSFSNVSTHDKSIAGSNFNYIYEYINGEMHFYSVHVESKKCF